MMPMKMHQVRIVLTSTSVGDERVVRDGASYSGQLCCWKCDRMVECAIIEHGCKYGDNEELSATLEGTCTPEASDSHGIVESRMKWKWMGGKTYLSMTMNQTAAHLAECHPVHSPPLAAARLPVQKYSRHHYHRYSYFQKQLLPASPRVACQPM